MTSPSGTGPLRIGSPAAVAGRRPPPARLHSAKEPRHHRRRDTPRPHPPHPPLRPARPARPRNNGQHRRAHRGDPARPGTHPGRRDRLRPRPARDPAHRRDPPGGSRNWPGAAGCTARGRRPLLVLSVPEPSCCPPEGVPFDATAHPAAAAMAAAGHHVLAGRDALAATIAPVTGYLRRGDATRDRPRRTDRRHTHR